jgi:endonuclease/exonuclease/phosphatase family metal-dependent hydrolase
MTYQVNGGQGYGAARRIGEEWNVDVLLLQDARRPPAGSFDADILREVADALRMEIAWLSLNDVYGGVSGVAILSRVGIEAERREIFDRIEQAWPQRGALGIDIDWGGKPFTIWTTRLSEGEQAAGQQHAETRQLLLAMQADPPGADIVGGDFALDPKGAPLDALRGTLRDAWLERGSGLGYTDPSDLPRRRADYVWYDAKGGIEPANAWVINAPGESSRLPLIVDFVPRRPDAAPLGKANDAQSNAAGAAPGGDADGRTAPRDGPPTPAERQPPPGVPDLPGITRPWGPRGGR